MKTGIKLIAEERQRQIDVECWTSEHDDQYKKDFLALAAASYALPSYSRPHNQFVLKLNDFQSSFVVPLTWPFDDLWWKPTPMNRIRELQKAGALIAAEIDRLQRLAQHPNNE